MNDQTEDYEIGTRVVKLRPANPAPHDQSPATRYADRMATALNTAAETLLDAGSDNDADEDADRGRLPVDRVYHLSESLMHMVSELPDVAATMRAALPAGPDADRAHRLRLALQRIVAETNQLTADLAAQTTGRLHRTGGTP